MFDSGSGSSNAGSGLSSYWEFDYGVWDSQQQWELSSCELSAMIGDSQAMEGNGNGGGLGFDQMMGGAGSSSNGGAYFFPCFGESVDLGQSLF